MKTLFALLAAAALITVLKPATASADGVALGKYCQVVAPGLTQGECAKLVATTGPVYCKIDLGGTPLWRALGFKSPGECVSEVQQDIREFLRTFP